MSRRRSRGSKFDPFDSATELMHLLQNRLCMRILRLLSLRRRNVSDVADLLEVGRTHVSHTLGALSDCGIVISERVKKNVIYGVNPALEIRIHDDHLEAILHCKNGDLVHFVTSTSLERV